METKREIKKGFISGAFDLRSHAGHVMMLHIDPSNERDKKTNRLYTYERYIKLSGCKYISKVVPYETEDDLYLMPINEKPYVRFLGENYRNKDCTGKCINDITIPFINRNHGFSSSELRDRIRGLVPPRSTSIFGKAALV